jgi:hypothetical protein
MIAAIFDNCIDLFEVETEIQEPSSDSSDRTVAESNRTNRGEKRYECHKCDFHRTVQVGKEGYNCRGKFQQKARLSIVIHYLGEHLSLTMKDTTPHISNNSMLCYSCPSCAFQTHPMDPQSLTYSQLNTKKISSMRLLFNHCKTVHDDYYGISPLTLIQLEEDARLTEGEDYFKCPQEGCQFFVSCLLSRGESLQQYIDQSKKNKNNFRYSRKSCGHSKLGRHFIEQHDIPPSSAAGAGADHRRHCEQIMRRNTDSFQCFRCEYTTPYFGYSTVTGTSGYRYLCTHYAAQHLL